MFVICVFAKKGKCNSGMYQCLDLTNIFSLHLQKDSSWKVSTYVIMYTHCKWQPVSDVSHFDFLANWPSSCSLQ